MSVRGDHPTRCRFQLLQKLVLRVLVRVQALAPAPAEVEVEEEEVAEVVERGLALECSWEEQEAVLVLELAVLC